MLRSFAPIALAAAMPAQKVLPYPTHVDDLANGLRVVTVPTDFPDIVAIHVIVATGSRNEVEEGKSGFAHFFEHMMFRGTKNYSSAEQAALFKKAGADRNAYTTNDFTDYHTTFAKADLETVLMLEADRFQNLSYARDAFRTEAMAVFGEYNKNSSSPLEKLFEVLQDTAFDRHTYKHTTMGFLGDIVKMPRQYDYSREFFRRWYRPEHTTILVVGDVDRDAVRALVDEHWGGWPRGDHAVEVPAEPPQTAPRSCHVPWPSATQPWLAIAFKGPAFSAADREMATLDLIASLAFGPNSRVYKKLVVRDQVVTELEAYFPDSTDPYLLFLLARVEDSANLAQVRDELLRTCTSLQEEPVVPGELERVKAHLRYAFLSRLDSSEAIAQALVGVLARTRDPQTLDAVFARYAEVTPADVQRVARTYFTADRRTIGTVAEGEQPPLADDAAHPATHPTTQSTTTPANAVLLPSRSPLISFRLQFLTGSAEDPPAARGVTHVTAAMLAEGATTERTYEDMLEALFPMAASIGFQVDKEMTTFTGTVHRDNLESYWALLREALTRPAFASDDLDRVKLAVRSFLEVELRGNNDEELGKEVLYREIFAGHPYGHHSAGSLGDVARLELDDIRQCYRSRLRADRLVVGLAGGYPQGFPERVARELDAALSGSGGAAPPVPEPTPIDRSRMTIVEKTTRATGIHFGLPIAVDRSHPDWVALWLLRSWLGEHRSENSHLYQRLRELRGLNYGDYAYIEYFPRGMFQFQPDPNLARRRQIFQVWIRPVPPENAAFACRAAVYELRKLLREGLSPAAFAATRQFLAKQVDLLVKTQDRRLGYALDSRFYGIGDFTELVKARLDALTLDEVNRVLRTHLRADRMQFVVVTENGAAFRDAVLGDGPSPVTYQAPPAADVLAEDEVIGHTDIGVRPEDVAIVPVAEIFR